MKELENMNLITVFTPTYNRAYCLNKCYDVGVKSFSIVP